MRINYFNKFKIINKNKNMRTLDNIRNVIYKDMKN